MKILLKMYIYGKFNPILIMQILHGQVRTQRNLKQKHAARIAFNKDKLSHSKPLFEDLNALSLYQINIYKHLIPIYLREWAKRSPLVCFVSYHFSNFTQI